MTDAAAPPAHDFRSISSHMVRGAAWMVAMRWSLKAIGFVNTLVLARLLTPDDFGLIAMAMIAVAFLQLLAELNVDLALLRSRDSLTREHYDSAWTVQALAGFMVTGAMLVAAGPLAVYYGDPRVEAVIQIVALRAAIMGLRNVGIVDFRRELNFSKEFRYWLYHRMVMFVLALGLVLWTGSYIGLALAVPLSATVSLVLSYTMSPYRPRLSFARFRETWSFSQWLILYNTTVFADAHADEFVIGGMAETQAMGHYYMANDVSILPTREVVEPIGRALVPTYAKISHDRTEMCSAYHAVMAYVATLCLPIGVGMAVVAEDFVHVVLGDRWADSVSFFPWLALTGAVGALVTGSQPYFVVLGRERTFALLQFTNALILVPTLFLVGHRYGIPAIPFVRLAVTGFMVAMVSIVLVRIGGASLRGMAAAIWRPIMAAGLMAAGVHAAMLEPGTVPRVVSLAASVAVGLVLYPAALLALWGLAGRPNGPERTVLANLRQRIGRRLRRGQQPCGEAAPGG